MHATPSSLSPALDAAQILHHHRAQRLRRRLVLLCLAVACIAAFIVDAAVGPSNLSIGQIVTGIVAPDRLSDAEWTIVWQIRLPYAVMAALVGVALALSGAEMQTVLNNALASPFTLGVSSAASFGASLAIVLGMSLPILGADAAVAINAFVFAFGSVLLLQALAHARRGGVQSIVLFGIALVFAFNALTALVQYIASQEALQQLVFWTMGSLSRSNWQSVAVMAVVLALCIPFSWMAARALTALRLGDDRAMSSGVNVTRLRFMSLLRASLMAAASVAFVGVIGFIGLVAPHIARLLVGEDHRLFLPASMLSGALVMSLASIVSKTLIPGALLPVGVVTAVIGVPAFLVLIFRNGAQG